jgi:hypothetical protein
MRGSIGSAPNAWISAASGGRSAPGWARADPESGESLAARVSLHVGSGGVADQGQGSMSFSRRCSTWTPVLARSEARPPTRRDTRLRTLLSCDRMPHLVRPSILCRAPRVPVPSGTHGEPRTLTARISLTVHPSTSLRTDRRRPHLCKAVRRSRLTSWVVVWGSPRTSKPVVRLIVAAGEILHIENGSADGTQILSRHIDPVTAVLIIERQHTAYVATFVSV